MEWIERIKMKIESNIAKRLYENNNYITPETVEYIQDRLSDLAKRYLSRDSTPNDEYLNYAQFINVGDSQIQDPIYGDYLLVLSMDEIPLIPKLYCELVIYTNPIFHVIKEIDSIAKWLIEYELKTKFGINEEIDKYKVDQQTKDKLESFIVDNDIDLCLKEIQHHTKELPNLNKEAILLRRRMSELEQQRTKGILEFSSYSIFMNGLTDSVLGLISKICNKPI
ncbi:MAG: hypothetical protein H6577_00520 [Lewinellaceae bacterium]|nr:hypothetical protein [Lewinellaceae bacterium]